MSAEDRVWTLLGIEPTDNPRAIRTAYSARLKTIDPETDPQAFVQLRWAYEEATKAPGRQEPPPRHEPLPEALTTSERPFATVPAYPFEHPAEDASWERHAKAIHALLYGHRGEDPWLGPDERDALIATWRMLVADPAMEQIGHYDRIERWARKVIVETSPLSAPILMIAAERFKWIDGDTKTRPDPYTAEIARRYRLLELLRKASRPGTPWHPAWIELKEPADVMSNYGRVDPRRVFEILAAMRYALPGLEGEFDPHRVTAWEAWAERSQTPIYYGSKAGHRWPAFIAVAIVIAIVIFLRVAGLFH